MAITPYTLLGQMETPIVDTARTMAGTLGAIAITIAALMATASSANASIMASSRIKYALGRDRVLPNWLNAIHPRFLAPFRPILITGLLTGVMILISDVEALSSSASVLCSLTIALST